MKLTSMESCDLYDKYSNLVNDNVILIDSKLWYEMESIKIKTTKIMHFVEQKRQ